MLGLAALWGQHHDGAPAQRARAITLAKAAGLDYVAISALSNCALLDVMTAGPADERHHAEEAVELAAKRGWPTIPQTACAHTALALLAFYDLRPSEAAGHLDRASATAARFCRRQLDFVIAHLGARLQGALGDPRAGLRVLDDFDALHRYRGNAPPYEHASMGSMRARLQIASGELDAAERTLAAITDDGWLVVDMAQARLQLARGEPADAVETLVAAAGKVGTHAVTHVEHAALEAIARAENGEPQAAARALERALALTETNRHRWPYLELGRRMEGLLRAQIRAGTAHRAIVGELLDLFADRAPAPRNVSPLLEPLSERERAILRYLPTALSNREIAAELFVTTNTVKTHLRSIYRKLDVARRRDAVDRARDLRLLSGASRR
jgi:LuxR family maltose regulon positive regulatory protein